MFHVSIRQMSKPTKRRLEELMTEAKKGNRDAAREGFELCAAWQRRLAARRHWSIVRWAVRVRPYALHWLEEIAKHDETHRISQAKNGVICDF